MALFGSPLEKEIKKHAAEGEPAWKTAGQKAGIECWRVEQFKIVAWPHERLGQVHEGDSYIFLYTYETADHVKHWHVHFWLGKFTTQDEAGTAAYKTVELDDFLGGTPVQYREVQGYESDTFHALFPHGMRILKGGCASGFHHIAPVDFEHRLLHIKGKINHTVVRRVNLCASSLNEGDAFILDMGKTLYQFNGRQAGIGEKSKAAQLTRSIDDERGGIHVVVVTTLDADDDFWAALGGKGPVKSAGEGGADGDLNLDKKALFKLDDKTGTMTFSEVPCKKESLEDDEVFIFDCINTVWIWVGNKASTGERKAALHYAHHYLKSKGPDRLHTPIVRVLQGAENEEFAVNWK